MLLCWCNSIVRYKRRMFHCFLSGYPACQDEEKGSKYIQNLCKVFSEHGKEMELTKMLTLVNSEAACGDYETDEGQMKQMPSFTSTLTERMFFKQTSTQNSSTDANGSQKGGMRDGSTLRYSKFWCLEMLALFDCVNWANGVTWTSVAPIISAPIAQTSWKFSYSLPWAICLDASELKKKCFPFFLQFSVQLSLT